MTMQGWRESAKINPEAQLSLRITKMSITGECVMPPSPLIVSSLQKNPLILGFP